MNIGAIQDVNVSYLFILWTIYVMFLIDVNNLFYFYYTSFNREKSIKDW